MEAGPESKVFTAFSTAIFNENARIPMLSGDNYAEWKEKVLLTLGLSDLDLALRGSIRGSISNSDKFKAYMKVIGEQFVSSNKALASTLMKRLSSMTFDRSRTMREHIMEMRDIATKHKSLEVDMFKPFFMDFILKSLPAEYGPFKISYNTNKDK
ncbi:PREDICTED: uncharacterized protein LOC109221611 [Nicotiana attenuata]|uniref:uncharacterized protein LOC109221611 n=1 Tax=Nicotiana attenuata TaxID=49451 RepID=UPI0009057A0B|nr:PREDICTED: uncharacterized protein LOC109221611 [Nicotiana attenuata]